MTENIPVSALSSPADWTDIGSAPSDVQLPDDEYATRIVSASSTDTNQYTLAANTIPAGSTINSIAVHFRAVGPVGGGTIRPRLWLSGNYSDGADTSIPNFPFTDSDITITRPGGGAWSLADLTSLEIAVRNLVTANYTSITTLYAIADYTPGGPPATTGDMLLVF